MGVLDAMRRRQTAFRDPLVLLLMKCFVENLAEYDVHPLTQATWCLVELEALELTGQLPPNLLPSQEGESPSVSIMRLALGRLEELNRQEPFTPTQLCYVQQLVRAYHYKHELDFGLQPQHLRAFCRSLFNV